jgi:hypothetical protein
MLLPGFCFPKQAITRPRDVWPWSVDVPLTVRAEFDLKHIVIAQITHDLRPLMRNYFEVPGRQGLIDQALRSGADYGGEVS